MYNSKLGEYSVTKINGWKWSSLCCKGHWTTGRYKLKPSTLHTLLFDYKIEKWYAEIEQKCTGKKL